MPEFHLHRGTAASVGVGACAKKVNMVLDISADGEVELRVLAGGGMCYSVGCRGIGRIAEKPDASRAGPVKTGEDSITFLDFHVAGKVCRE